MKYELIEILFSWLTTPVLHLNLMQIFIAFSELLIMCYIVKGIIKLSRRVKGVRR